MPDFSIKGSPENITKKSAGLRSKAASYDGVATALTRIDKGSWTGRAAKFFKENFDDKEPQKWRDAAGGFRKAANAFDAYAAALKTAQSNAEICKENYNKGVAQSKKDRDLYEENVRRFNGAIVSQLQWQGPVPTLVDRGAPMMQKALTDFQGVKSTLDGAAQACVEDLHGACENAPKENFWTDAGQLGSGLFGGVFDGAKDIYKLYTVDGSHDDVGGLTAEEKQAQLDLFGKNLADGLKQAWSHKGSMFVSALKGLTAWDDWKDHPWRATGEVVGNIIPGGAIVKFGSKSSRLAGFLKAAEEAGSSASETSALGKVEKLEDSSNPHLHGMSKRDSGLKGTSSVAASAKQMSDALRAAARKAAKIDQAADPVDVVTGEVLLPETDLTLPGVLELALSRIHRSNMRDGQCFGPSWASWLDQRLDLDAEEDAVVFTDHDGSRLVFPLPQPGGTTQSLEGPARELFWPHDEVDTTDEGGEFPTAMRLYDPVSVTSWWFAGAVAGGPVLPLIAVHDGYHNTVAVRRDSHGFPQAIVTTAGQVVEVVESNGRVGELWLTGGGAERHLVRRFGYDAGGNLVSVTNSSGQAHTFGYDDEHRLLWWRDRNGSRYDYGYDDRGRCVVGTGTDGILTSSFVYLDADESGVGQTRYVDALGNTTVYEHTGDGQVVAATDPTGRRTQTQWWGVQQPARHVDAAGGVTRWEYSALGQLISLTYPDGSHESVGYDDRGGVTTHTLQDGTVWHFTTDEANAVTSVTDPMGAITRFEYGDEGGLTSSRDATGVETRVECDAAGLPVTVTLPTGGVIQVTRDVFGRVVEQRDSAGALVTTSYDTDGRVTSWTDPDGVQHTFVYDAEGNLLTDTDAAGRVTSYTYTPFDEVASIARPDGSQLRVVWDTLNRPVEVIDEEGRTWTTQYDAAGRVLGRTDVNGRTLTYDYDVAGRLERMTNASGQVLTYSYDQVSRVAATADSTGSQVQYIFDPVGRVAGTRTLSPSGSVVTHEVTRDAVGRVRAAAWNGRELTYRRDDAGRVVQRTTASGQVARTDYAAGTPESLTVSGAEAIAFGYDGLGQEVTRGLGAGFVQEFAYSGAGRLTSSLVRSRVPGNVSEAASVAGRASAVAGREYQWDRSGELIGYTEVGGVSRRFSLDAVGQIREVVDPAGSVLEAVGYDRSGTVTERLLGADGVIPREVSGTRVTRVGNWRYVYDADGRVVSKTHATLDGQRRTWRYAWDASDQLVSTTGPDGKVFHDGYDGLGHRVLRTTGLEHDDQNAWQWWVWDGEVLVEQGDVEGVSVWQVHPVTGEVIGHHRRARDQEWVDAEFNRIVGSLTGDPTAVVTAAGVRQVVSGSVWGRADPDPDGVTGGLGFAGQVWDRVTGWFFNHFRYYDPDLAGFTSSDPAGLAATVNPHTYVPNPTTWCDVSGLTPYRGYLKTDRNRWRSPGGLRYDKIDRGRTGFNNRLDHVEHHSADNPNRPSHGVFDGNPYVTIDEAWMLVKARHLQPTSLQGKKVTYVVDLGRDIGYAGGQSGAKAGFPRLHTVKLVLQGHRVISAFPIQN